MQFLNRKEKTYASAHAYRCNDQSARGRGVSGCGRAGKRLGRIRCGRTSLRERQHRGSEHDRSVQPPRRRHTDAVAGSPFAAGGAGSGAGIGSQGALQITSDGKYLLAVDAGSNQISVLRINSDGELNPVGGGPVSSGGVKPVSIAVHGSLVYVANAGDSESNYTGFTLNPGGHLRPLTVRPWLCPPDLRRVMFFSTVTEPGLSAQKSAAR